MQKIINFFKEVRDIFYNITWPKKEALIQLTIVVISISIIISLILGGFDYLFTNSFALISNQKPAVSTSSQSTTIEPTITLAPLVASPTGTIKK